MKRFMYILLLMAALVPFFGAASGGDIARAEGTVPAENIDRAIDGVINRPEYTWRMPREKFDRPEIKTGILAGFFKRVSEWMGEIARKIAKLMKKLAERLEKFFGNRNQEKDRNIDWHTPLQAALFVILALSASIMAIQLYRAWKNRGKGTGHVDADPVYFVPDLADENVMADDLPSAEWLRLAGELIGKGDLRMAVRAMFLACLADLAHHNHIVIARYKSNREYIYELRRKGHGRPVMVSAFESNVSMLECAWYGMHDVTESIVANFRSNQDIILNEAKN